jgi:hypothetical protein
MSEKCKAGLHWLTDSNTIIEKQYAHAGINRKCRACYNAKKRAWKKANRDWEKTHRTKHVQSAHERGLAPDDPRHGKENSYVYWGCRCEECVEAMRTARRLRKLKRKAREMGLDVDAILPKKTKGQIMAIGGFADTGGFMDQQMDPVLDEVLERLEYV